MGDTFALSSLTKKQKSCVLVDCCSMKRRIVLYSSEVIGKGSERFTECRLYERLDFIDFMSDIRRLEAKGIKEMLNKMKTHARRVRERNFISCVYLRRVHIICVQGVLNLHESATKASEQQ